MIGVRYSAAASIEKLEDRSLWCGDGGAISLLAMEERAKGEKAQQKKGAEGGKLRQITARRKRREGYAEAEERIKLRGLARFFQSV